MQHLTRYRIGSLRRATAGLVVLAGLLARVSLAAEAREQEAPPQGASAATGSTERLREEELKEVDAERRREARRDWYGGDPAPEYRVLVMKLAEAERVRERARLKARDASGQSAESLAAQGPAAHWVNLGPTRANFEWNGSVLPGAIDSGRISAILVHPTQPNVIYLATAGGGVWKTTNGGAAWTPITDSLGSLAVGALEMDPQDPNRLYLGLGDPYDPSVGLGFLRSSDGGDTWSAPVFLQCQIGQTMHTATYIKQILAGPDTPGLLLAATDVALFRSTDSGATWSCVNDPTITLPTPVWSIAWAGGSNFAISRYGIVHFSSDNGLTWTQATGVQKNGGLERISLAAAPSSRNVMYALAAGVPDFSTGRSDFGDIFRSVDGGRSWTALNADRVPLTNRTVEADLRNLLGYQGRYNQLALVSPTDPNVAYFAGATYLVRTTDGGLSYTQLTDWLGQARLPYVHADFHAGAFDNAGTFYVGTDGGIFKSGDAGHSWTSNLNIGIVSHLAYSIGSSLANRDAVISGTQDVGTRVRVGSSSVFNQPLGGDGFGVNAHATNPNLMLSSIYFNQIYRSYNAGATFFSASVGIGPSDNFFTKLVPGLGDPTGNTIYTLTRQAAYQTTNYAQNWTPLGDAGLPPTSEFALRNIGASKSDPQVLGLVATGGRVYTSSNGGLTWDLAAPLPNSTGALSYIWFDTTNSQTVYVSSVAFNGNSNHMWKSTDFGTNWTAIGVAGSGFPSAVPVNFVVNDPTNPATLFAGTLIGLYRSDDAGTTWAQEATGLPRANVTDIYISPDGTIKRVSTWGRGFWELFEGSNSAFTIAPTSLPSGTVGVPYPPQFLTTQGATCPCSFAVTSGWLPPGLSLSESGVVYGTPGAAGRSDFIVTVTDSTEPSSGGPLVARQFYSVSIPSHGGVTLLPSSLPTGLFGSTYPATVLTATGARSPYSFSISNGSLPPGLTLSSLGLLYGTPTAAGAYAFTVLGTDGTPPQLSGPFSGQRAYEIVIAKAPQTVFIDSINSKYLGEPDFTVFANATSGGAVVLGSLSPGVCTVNGFLVHLAAEGTCTLLATQAGDANHEPAQQTRSFSVLPVDVTPPSVVALTRGMPSPTMSDVLTWTLRFSEPVTGVTPGDFTVFAAGISGAAVTEVFATDEGASWTVVVGTGRGNGQLRLDLQGTGAIRDGVGNPLAAVTINGESYQLDKGGTVIGAGQGTPDPSFGSGGYALFDASPFTGAPEVAVLPDGRILAAGFAACDADSEWCSLQLARYLPSGAPDPTFGNNGRLVTTVTRHVWVNPPILRADGSFFVVGVRLDEGHGAYEPFVARFTGDGAPDASFGVDGRVTLAPLPSGFPIIGSTADAAGRVVVVGTTPVVAGQGNDIFVTRLTPLGAVDTTFGANGVARLAISTVGNRRDHASSVVVQADGNILVGGRTVGSLSGTSSVFDYLLLRLDENGTLDPTFGAGGIVTTRFVDPGSNIGRSIALQPDGRILFFGSVPGPQCGVARYLANGSRDGSFGVGGKALVPLLESCLDIRWQEDGKMLLTGFNAEGDVSYVAFVRLMPNGAVDTAFGTNGLVEISTYDFASRPAITASGRIVTSLVFQDPGDGLQKSYVVQLAGKLAEVTQTVVRETSPVISVTGQPYTVTVRVTAPGGTPDGEVVISDDLGASCTIPALSGGVGSCALASRAAGTRMLTASYSGSSGYRSSTGTRSHAVGQAETRTALFTGANPVLVGAPLMMTATTTAIAPGQGVPTGLITFSDGKTVLGTAPLDVTGSATLMTSSLPAGTANLTARYAGDPNCKDSKSDAVKETVEKLPTVAFSGASTRVAEAAGFVVLTVERTGSTLGASSVSFATADGTANAPLDYLSASGSLSWVAGDKAPKLISITVATDNLRERAETFRVTLSLPMGATLGNNRTITVTIRKK